MENVKTKNVGKIVLTVYVTIVTIAAILFGSLYLSKLFKNNKLDAKGLINTVCYDMGFLSEKEYKDAVSNTTDFYNNSEHLIKSLLFWSKFCIDNGKENTYYTSSASYKMNDKTYSSTGYLFYETTEDTLTINLFDTNNKSNIVIVIKTNTKDKWLLQGYLPEKTFTLKDGYQYFEIKANTENVYSYYEEKVALSNKDNITAENIDEITVFENNKNTNTNVNKSNSDFTDNEKVEITKRLKGRFENIKLINFNTTKFTESNFLKETYKMLGYNVI